LVRANLFLVEPVGRARAETEGDDHRVRRQHLLAARDRFRTTATVGIGLAHARFHHFHASDLAAFADNLDRLAVVQELHALFLRVRHFATRTRHVFLVTTVGTGNARGTLADRGAVTVHRGITTTEHDHALALHVDEVRSVFFETEVAVGIGHQERQHLMHTVEILTREAALHVGVGTHAHEHGIVFRQQFVDGDILADLGVETELDTHAFKDFTALGHDRLFQLELGNAEGQQATDFRIAIKYHRLDTIAYQHVGATKTGRAGTDNGNFLVCRHHARHVRAPAHGNGCVGDVLLGGTDSHGTEAVVQCTGALTQAILRAHAATDFRQRVGLVTQLHRFHQVAFSDQLQPVRDVVVNRALPLAIRITAGKATMC